MSIKIITNNLRGRQPLYYKYANEFKPQPAYISLHEDGCDCRLVHRDQQHS